MFLLEELFLTALCLTFGMLMVRRNNRLFLQSALIHGGWLPPGDRQILSRYLGEPNVLCLWAKNKFFAGVAVVSGQPILLMGDYYLSDDLVLACTALHEAGHLQPHQRKASMALAVAEKATPLISVMLPMYWFPGWAHVPHFILAAGFLYAGLRVLSIPVRWWMEFDADLFAAKRLGYRAFLPGFSKTLRPALRYGDSTTHPSAERRLRRLRRLAKEGKIPE